ncbi:MAG TPA: aldehyde dehydrogenase family protein, partial [Terrimesophilobacter sp.]|nr:aldehyde dehydrogenase family protein [Terrimesophilobacter sp.]
MTATREKELLASVPDKLFITGKWVDATGGGTLDVHDPPTGKGIRTIADATPDDAKKAMDAAADTQASWAAVPARERSNILRRAFDLLTERADDFALLMTIEMGKPLAESMGEVKYGAEFL